MAKRIEPDETIHTAFEDILSTVTKDIRKDFDISNFNQEREQKYLSTGVAGINYAICGKFDGGFPEGWITELYGENSCVSGDTIVEIQIVE